MGSGACLLPSLQSCFGAVLCSGIQEGVILFRNPKLGIWTALTWNKGVLKEQEEGAERGAIDLGWFWGSAYLFFPSLEELSSFSFPRFRGLFTFSFLPFWGGFCLSHPFWRGYCAFPTLFSGVRVGCAFSTLFWERWCLSHPFWRGFCAFPSPIFELFTLSLLFAALCAFPTPFGVVWGCLPFTSLVLGYSVPFPLFSEGIMCLSPLLGVIMCLLLPFSDSMYL